LGHAVQAVADGDKWRLNDAVGADLGMADVGEQALQSQIRPVVAVSSPPFFRKPAAGSAEQR
jgi:hypothetical protein